MVMQEILVKVEDIFGLEYMDFYSVFEEVFSWYFFVQVIVFNIEID